MISPTTKKSRSGRDRLIARARHMRHEPTDAERKFWVAVRGRRFGGYKFKRQYPVGRYIVDFVCLERHLIVELDGGQHTQQQEYDAERTDFLNMQGFSVQRIWNDEFLKRPDGILEGVLRALISPSPAAR